MRRLFAILVGLIMPLGVSLVLMTAASERVGETYVVARRVADTLPPSTYLLTPSEVERLPAEFRHALAVAAQSGEAAVRLRGAIGLAWTEIRAQAGDAAWLAATVEGVPILLEARGPSGWAERVLAGVEIAGEWIVTNGSLTAGRVAAKLDG